jgi:hypothetical protein
VTMKSPCDHPQHSVSVCFFFCSVSLQWCQVCSHSTVLLPFRFILEQQIRINSNFSFPLSEYTQR